MFLWQCGEPARGQLSGTADDFDVWSLGTLLLHRDARGVHLRQRQEAQAAAGQLQRQFLHWGLSAGGGCWQAVDRAFVKLKADSLLGRLHEVKP